MTDEQNIPQWAISAAIDLAGTHAGGAIEEVACIIAKHAPQPMGAEEAAETDIADVRRELREAGIEGISFEGAGELLKKLATAQAENTALRKQLAECERKTWEKAARLASTFSWILPMHDDSATNTATDDAACAVCKQLSDKLRRIAEETPGGLSVSQQRRVAIQKEKADG